MRFVAPSAHPPWRVHFPEPDPSPHIRSGPSRNRSAARRRLLGGRKLRMERAAVHGPTTDESVAVMDGGPFRERPFARERPACSGPAPGTRHVPLWTEVRGGRWWRPGVRARPISEELGWAARPDGSWFLVARFQARFVPPAPFLTTLAVCPSPEPSGMFHPVTLVGFGTGRNHPLGGPWSGGPKASPSAVAPVVESGSPG
jgi:hypothetical protein